jgi:hypothetical protein
MFFDTDLLVVVGVIFAVTALFWSRSFAQLAWARTMTRAEQNSVTELPFAVAPSTVGSRKAVLRRMVPAVVAVKVPEIAPAVEPIGEVTVAPKTGRLSVDTQVARIAEIVTRAVDGARDADRLHHAAHEQLDAAHYALQNLLHELSAVMSVPGLNVARAEKPNPEPEVAAAASFETAMAA